ncbi:DNA topoisomerase IB [Humibacter albus]|uniref:DNA topoisomerase IB n=1 Tax=Humibacter albus TaxID=427754 RepID=UPI0003B4CD0E|nr:DNA topoisomerase [Humibacter albus]
MTRLRIDRNSAQRRVVSDDVVNTSPAHRPAVYDRLGDGEKRTAREASGMTNDDPARPRTRRLRRSDPNGPGLLRVPGDPPRYTDARGRRIVDERQLERILALAIPPAWSDVWICSDERGHIQAVGVDDAGRRQYLYHEQWRAQRDAVKFERVLLLARALPHARRTVTHDLKSDGFGFDRALAAAFRVIDRVSLRIGSEEYRRRYGSRGLTTMLCRDVTVDGDMVLLSFPSKSGQRWESAVTDAGLARYLDEITRARRPGSRAISWRDSTWHALTTAEVNDDIRRRTGVDATAKDFRTLRGSVVAASTLARIGSPETKREKDAAVRAAIAATADALGNTPAVARASYIDPRVFDRYRSGELLALGCAPEAALCALLE